MTRRLSSLRDEAGQSAVIAVLFVAVLLGMTATVLDVGSWFRAQRASQAAADAAALAGAQALPLNPATAQADALDYAARNGGGLAASDVQIDNGEVANDTIHVRVGRDVPGLFSRIFGLVDAGVSANASARAFSPGAAKWVAPIVVNITHPDLSGPGCPCFGLENSTALTLEKTGAPGAFDMLNLDPDKPNGTIGTSTLAAWVKNGFDEYLPLGGYYSDPGAKFNSSQIKAALSDRLQTELLFPVYDTLSGTGSNATYHIIGWAAFHLTGYSMGGNGGTLTGYFSQTIWDGIEATTGVDAPDLGVLSVELVK